MKEILETFDINNLLIKEYKHWYLLLRKRQVTIGSLVLIEKSFKTRYSDISFHSHCEFASIVIDIESSLQKNFNYDKINYLMLMMVDKEVHYHIIPRYSRQINFNGFRFIDSGWPSMPDLSFENTATQSTIVHLIDSIRASLND